VTSRFFILVLAAAAGGSVHAAPVRSGALIIEGALTAGDVPGKFEKVIDLQTGHSRTVQAMGTSRMWSGYDGEPWVASNGIVNVIDLPALVADARAQAFVDREGWRKPDAAERIDVNGRSRPSVATVRFRPAGGSAVEVVVDERSGLVKQVTMDTDDGPLVTSYADWRSIGPIQYPFLQVQTDNTGSTTILHHLRLSRACLDVRAESRQSQLRSGSLRVSRMTRALRSGPVFRLSS
jgi:hypothetical protein